MDPAEVGLCTSIESHQAEETERKLAMDSMRCCCVHHTTVCTGAC